eukprot:4816533-Prymnesium_polylepis.1
MSLLSLVCVGLMSIEYCRRHTILFFRPGRAIRMSGLIRQAPGSCVMAHGTRGVSPHCCEALSARDTARLRAREVHPSCMAGPALERRSRRNLQGVSPIHHLHLPLVYQ